MAKLDRLSLAWLITYVIACAPGSVSAWEPGSYPAAPQQMHSSGFSVNNQDRNDVLAFWHAVYQASEGYEKRIAWNGNYSGNNGTVSTAFVKDVERRLNYFRAMSGVDSNASVSGSSTVLIEPTDQYKPSPSTLKATAAQSGALMMVRNYNPESGQNPALTHFPPKNLTGWSPMAWNAMSKGNLAFGFYGPGAITEYMIEQYSSSTATSSWNALVGHRRWNLNPKATVFATGDQPGTSARQPPTNVFYVRQKASELRENPVGGFVVYPAAGFFPVDINSPYWSLSRDGADFSSATVKMTTASGISVPIISVRRDSTHGDPAIIWEVGAQAKIRSVYNDTTFNVLVSGIRGVGIPSSYNYSVTLINPDRLTSNQQISGPASVVAGKSGNYTFTPPAGAEGMQVTAFRKKSTIWKETAEATSIAKVIDGTASNYSLLVKTSSFAGFGALSGNSAFHLTFPDTFDLLTRGVPDQWFEIDRDLIAKSNAELKFQFRRGYMTRGSSLVVESSSDGGVSWKILGKPIKGVSDNRIDSTVTFASRPLVKSSVPLRIRFRYFATDDLIYTHAAAPKAPTGIFIDEITTSGCFWLEKKKTTSSPATAKSFVFSSTTAGAPLVKGGKWYLRLRTKLGGKWFPYGPVKPVTIIAP